MYDHKYLLRFSKGKKIKNMKNKLKKKKKKIY
jgi:hypothetical protein